MCLCLTQAHSPGGAASKAAARWHMFDSLVKVCTFAAVHYLCTVVLCLPGLSKVTGRLHVWPMLGCNAEAIRASDCCDEILQATTQSA